MTSKFFVWFIGKNVQAVEKGVMGLARHDKPGYMRHIGHKQAVRADFFGDGGKLGIV